MPGKQWMGYTDAAREEILVAAGVVYGSDAWGRLIQAIAYHESCVRADENRRVKEKLEKADAA